MGLKKVAFFGIGAVGAVYAAALSKTLGKENLLVFALGDRKERYEKAGVYLNGERLDLTYTSISEPVDLIIIATKNLQLDTVIKQMKGFVGKDTIIISLLNGLVSEEKIALQYGKQNILPAFAMGLNSEHVSNKIICTAAGQIVFGESDNKTSVRVQQIKALFDSAGIENKIPKSIQNEMWKKFALNTAYNTLSAVCKAGYGFFTACPDLEDLAFLILKEVQAVAICEGVEITDTQIEDIEHIIASLPFYGKTSMFQDFEARRKSENDYFAKTVVDKAKKYSLKVPVCTTLYKIAKAQEFIASYDKEESK